jgi:hypothetical protein
MQYCREKLLYTPSTTPLLYISLTL